MKIRPRRILENSNRSSLIEGKGLIRAVNNQGTNYDRVHII